MKRFLIFLTALFFLVGSRAAAQDTLPRFSVKNAGNNRVIIGWVNPFTSIKQISIQRSFDSARNFKTILTVADPKAVQNGFTDLLAPNDHMWYRLFYVMGNNDFFFTPAKQPLRDTSRLTNAALGNGTDNPLKQTVIKKPEYIPSYYVYTSGDGNVFINLPDADKKSYSIKFYSANNEFLFDIKSVKETGLTLDKANFLRAGWFNFELYNDDKLVERNRFYLAKSF